MARKKTSKRAEPRATRKTDGTFAKGSKHGGARPGAGRIPKAVRMAEDQLWASRPDAVEKALETLMELMQPGNGAAARFHAASKILDRVYGKARVTVNINDTTQLIVAKLDITQARTIESDVRGALPPGANDGPKDDEAAA